MKLTTIKIRPQKLERWKMIEGYSNYMVSTLGRVKSLGGDKNKKEKILKPKTNKGYLQVTLSKNGKKKMIFVHRLVGQAFIPNIENKPYIDHINTIRTDNTIYNLRWVARKENNNNPLTKKKLSESKKGKNHPMARKVRCIETGEVFNTIKQACEWCGIKSTSSIIRQVKGECKSAGKHPNTKEKLHWEYVD